MAEPKPVVQNKDVSIVAAFFFEHVHARNAKVPAALTPADHDIAGTLKEDSQLWQNGNLCLVLARIGLEHAQPGGGEKIERVAFEAAFGWERESDGLSCFLIVELNKNPRRRVGDK